jgi:hypothetical protein
MPRCKASRTTAEMPVMVVVVVVVMVVVDGMRCGGCETTGYGVGEGFLKVAS